MKQLEAPPTADELREIRLIYNLTPKEMGHVLNVGPQTVKSYESGKTPFPWKHLKRINRLLSKPVPPTPPCPPSPDELRLLRTSRGLTQKQVAEAFGLTYSSISNYEHGLTPIPVGLPECIKELAAPKEYLLQPGKSTARELLRRIDESRRAECEQWLRQADQVGPAELRRLRLSRGLSENNLSKMLGISKPILHFYEHGSRNIPQGLVRKILELCPDRVVTPSEITELRCTLGLKQSETGAAIGLTRNAIGYYEAGKRKISYKVSKKIMEFYREQVEDSDPATPQ